MSGEQISDGKVSLDEISVFLSYSHADRAAARALRDLLAGSGVRVWWDESLVPGQRFRDEILEQIEAADKVIVLWSASSVASDFVRDEADRARLRGKLVPLMLEDCDIPLGFREYHFTRITVGELAAKRNVILRALSIAEDRSRAATGAARRLVYVKPRLNYSRLPTTYARQLFGRDADMARLFEAWDSEGPAKTNIVVLDAIGGTGKTALAHHFVQAMRMSGWRGADSVYAWSFYSQGTHEKRQGSAELFLEDALQWFNYKGPPLATQHDKGVKLAELVAAQRTLLVLDGLEPLQYAAGRAGGGKYGVRGVVGSLKEPGVAALLKQLAADNAGLLVVTSRMEVSDLRAFAAPVVVQHRLERLAPAAGRELMRHLGVLGSDQDLDEAVADFNGHALALTSLSRYLAAHFNGDVRRRDTVPKLVSIGSQQDRDPFRVMDAYARAFQRQIEEQVGRGQKAADTAAAKQLAILSVLGLFDRPAEREAVDALLAPPVIPGLTDGLTELSRHQWVAAISALRDLGLVSPHGAKVDRLIDAHPLVREYFALRLQTEAGATWQAANQRLEQHYTALARDVEPATLDDMVPIGHAISHAAAAGRTLPALALYEKKIRSKINPKGLYPFDLSLLLNFFAEPWHLLDAAVPEDKRSLLLWQAATSLRNSGRLQEAAEALGASCALVESKQQWRLLADHRVERIEILIKLGQLDQAIAEADKALEIAQRHSIVSQLPDILCFRGHAYHQRGEIKKAKADFSAGTAAAKRSDGQSPKLSSFRQFAINELHLEQEALTQAGKWGKKALAEAQDPDFIAKKGPKASALGKLSLGRRELLLAARSAASDAKDEHYAEAGSFIAGAVNDLRNGSQLDELPGALLSRARLRRETGAIDEAMKDWVEARHISERFGMLLYCVDCYIEGCRILTARGTPADIRASAELVAGAAQIIADTHYERRTAEVAELGKMVTQLQNAIAVPPPEQIPASSASVPSRRRGLIGRIISKVVGRGA